MQVKPVIVPTKNLMASGITLYGTAAAVVAYAAYSHWMRSKEEKYKIGFHFDTSSSEEQNNTAMRLGIKAKGDRIQFEFK